MANYKVKKSRITCQHKEVLPPLTCVFIDEKGDYRHAGCETELDYIGTGQTLGTETEVRFYCEHCKESVALPILAFMRVEIRSGDTHGHHPDFAHLVRLAAAGDTLPTAQGNSLRVPVAVVKHENPVRCRLCHLPHYVRPAVTGGSQ